MELNECQKAEGSTLYNMLCTNLELYSRKLSTLQSTRGMIEDISKPDEFNEWDGMYMIRKALKLDIIKPQVSIIDRFHFCHLFEDIVEHYRTLLNTFKHQFSETADNHWASTSTYSFNQWNTDKMTFISRNTAQEVPMPKM